MRKALILLLSIISLHGCSGNVRPDSTTAFELISQAEQAYSQGRWSEAEQLYQRVNALVPRDHYTWFRLGNTQLRQGNWDSAIYSYQQSIRWNAKHGKTYYNLSIAHSMKALNSLKASAEVLRAEDPAQAVIAERIKILSNVLGTHSSSIEGAVSDSSAHMQDD